MKLNTKKTFYVGLAFLIISMFGSLYDGIIKKMSLNTFGLGDGLSGVIMSIDNILALFLIPLFGTLSDKTRTKYGRRTPFIVLVIIISAMLIPTIAIFDNAAQNKVTEANIPTAETIEEIDTTGTDQLKDAYYDGTLYESYAEAKKVQQARVFAVVKDNLFYFIGWVTSILLVLLAMAMYRSPAVALMPDVTPKPLRSKANAIINLMGAAGGVLIYIFIMILAKKDYISYIPLFVLTSLLMFIFLLIFLWKVKEPILVNELELENKKYGLEDQIDVTVDENDNKEKMTPAVRKSFLLILLSILFWFMAFNAATSSIATYTQNVYNMQFAQLMIVANITSIIAFMPIGILSSKFGRKKMILVGIGILIAAFLVGFLAAPKNIGTQATGFQKALIYVTMAVAGIGWATINVNSYPMVVEMSKGKNVGKYTGYYYTASMSAQVVTPILSGFLMQEISPKVLFPYSLFFCLLAFITMQFVKHGDSKPIPGQIVEE